MTKEDLIKLFDKEPDKYIEIYPLHWKNNKELNDICEARIKSGLGSWAQPIITTNKFSDNFSWPRKKK